ncbi:MAG TPA: UvrD-helicase domain-containing protein [Bryobacteraceae bacterium]
MPPSTQQRALSSQQRAAVEREAAKICVVAGPGSGKTRVLIERFAWLVESRGVDPGRILAITFTEKAANEMKRRLDERFAHRPDLREKIETAWLSTIDAFCARLLGEHAISAGLPPDFIVLDGPQAERMRKDSGEEILDELYQEKPETMRRLLESLEGDLADTLIELYETMRLSGRSGDASGPAPDGLPSPVLPEARELARTISAGSLTGDDAAALRKWTQRLLALPDTISRGHLELAANFHINLNRIFPKSSPAYQAASRLKKETLPQLEAQWLEEWHAGVPELIREALARLHRRFEEKKRQQGAVDFAGLEEKTIELLENTETARLLVGSRFDHVLMDELQDTNRLQWRLINLLGGNLFAVGDVNQSIYGFRHADRSVFEEYRQTAQIEELTENYRSRQEILEAVSRVLNGQPGVEPRALEARRAFPAAHGAVVDRLLGSAEGAAPAPPVRAGSAADAEADLVATRIREWVDSKERECRDIAILVRTLGSTPPFEQALARYGIPFLLSGGRTFLEARETRDLMALLAALANPLDEIALVTVLRSPLIGTAWTDERLLRESHEGWQAEFERLFGRVRKLAGHFAPDRLIAAALQERGYFETLGERERSNVDKFFGWLRREHRARPRPLAEMLEDLEALRDLRGEAEAPPPDSSQAVRIMTIHAAKGLEFPVVFLAAMHRGPERRLPAILFAPDRGLGIKWRNPVSGTSAPSAVYRELAEHQKQCDDAEESRLLYVAMTRAEDRLILSYAERKRPSRWMKLADLVDQVQPTGRVGFSPREASASPSMSGAEAPRGLKSALHDSLVSVTDVVLFHACPRKYYLERYLRLDSEPAVPDSDAIAFGAEVHRALAGGSTSCAEAADAAGRFHSSSLGRRAARASRVEREFDFLLAVGDVVEDVLVAGQIDLWFEEGGELILVDYKTTRDESAAGEYELQLRLYALALERYAGRLPDRAVLFFSLSGNVAEVSLTSEDLESARGAIRSLAAAQESLEFPMNPGQRCRRCAFFQNPCPAELGAFAFGGHFPLQSSP